MDGGRLDAYWLAIGQLEAQEALLQMKIMAYPHTTKESQDKVHRHFHRLAYPSTHGTTPIKTEEMAARLMAVVNGK